ncbi:ATP-binding cassette domain-containing protein [Bowmanella denitrificans]|uniref:ATP-binding cassette domain-containing protein n=1 Tax=Bowmanella denitrificans TaxID=366582 RepID=A0ABP3GLE4_9ALTE
MLEATQLQLSKRLKDIELVMPAGRFVHLLGPNGAGKSTLLMVLAGILQPQVGQVRLNGRYLGDYSPPALAGVRTLMEQNLQTAFALSVKECLTFYAPQLGIPELLEQALEIRQFLSRPLNTLSGGEQRRVQICRTLMQLWPAITSGRALILMDEPVQGLDFAHQHRLCQLLVTLADMGNMLVVSHHQLNLAQMYGHRIWLMSEGRLVADGSQQDVLNETTLTQIFQCGIRICTDSEQNRLIQTYL